MKKLTKGKRIVLICLTTPLLSFVLIQPDWLARLVADTLFTVIITVLIFIFVLYTTNPKALHNKRKPTVPETNKRKWGDRIIRSCIFLFGLLCLYCSTEIVYDSIQTFCHGSKYILKAEGRVVKNDSYLDLYFLHQSLSIELKTENGWLNVAGYQATFFPRIAHQEQTYFSLIAPKSKEVLDFENVSPNTDSR